MLVVIDSGREESVARFVRGANVKIVQKPDEDQRDDVPGDVGFPGWMYANTPMFNVFWIGVR